MLILSVKLVIVIRWYWW